jgi:hypothetical protein
MNSAKFDGVQEGKSGGKGPLGLPCAVTPEGRDRQLQGQWSVRVLRCSIQ